MKMSDLKDQPKMRLLLAQKILEQVEPDVFVLFIMTVLEDEIEQVLDEQILMFLDEIMEDNANEPHDVLTKTFIKYLQSRFMDYG